jgi:8-oxo-dGTP diphosphatase
MTTKTDVVGKPTVRVVAAVVEREGHYLITQRRETAVLPLLWEFPGGKVEPGEQDEDALKRELRERLDAEATIGKKLGEKIHEYDGYRVALALYAATLVEDPARPLVARRVKDFRWVASQDFDRYPFPDADQVTMDQLLGFTRA